MRLLLLAALFALTACGGESEASTGSDPVCAKQATDLADVRGLAEDLSEPDSQWGPGGPEQATEIAGEALTALTGYVPEDQQLGAVTDRAREAVKALHDDLEDDQTLEGSGQSADTARAALEALDEACS